MDDNVIALNTHLYEAVTSTRDATGVNIEFVPVAGRFEGHGVCQWIAGRFINALSPGVLSELTYDWDTDTYHMIHTPPVASASFHPNQKGNNAFYDAVRASLP